MRDGVVAFFEAAARHYDENWAEIETEYPDKPLPVLYVISSFGVSVGLPLYRAAKTRQDDARLLEVLEQVLTDEAFIGHMQSEVQGAPYLNPIQKRHLVTALNWLVHGHFVDAYPPFYNGLEAAFFSAARAKGIIDDRNRFLTKAGKAHKVDDVLDDLLENVRFKRFLRAWVFGDRGNPFRHGDVDDTAECRRQSLRLGVALVGWLEYFCGWQSDFTDRLELEARRAHEA